MTSWTVAALSLLLTADPAAHELREKIDVGTQIQSKVHLVIRGKIRADAKEQSLVGQALLVYPERVLEVGANGMAQRVARYYEDARAKFVLGTHEEPRQLRSAVRLMVGERDRGLIELWSPNGALTSEDKELVEDVIDTTRIPGLLPRDSVASGATWEVDADVVRSMCGLRHFISSTVKGTLESIDDSKATIKLAGDLHGLSMGTEVKAKIQATLVYDRVSNMVEQVTWQQLDSRGPSPISPPGSYEVKITVERSKTESKYLSDDVLAKTSTTPDKGSKLLLFTDADKRYRFYHDRNWHVTMQTAERLVMRRLEDGDFVAQLNVTPVGGVNPSKVKPDELQAMVEQAGGWKIDEVIRADNLPTSGAYDLQLLIATGTSGAVKLNQKHYLATTANRQVILTFLVEPKNEDKLGTVDQSLVGTLEFMDSAAAERPSGVKK